MEITKNISVSVDITLEDAARAFCEMDGQEQAAFFDTVAAISSNWDSPASFQWADMEKHLTVKAASTLKELGQYSQPVKTI